MPDTAPSAAWPGPPHAWSCWPVSSCCPRPSRSTRDSERLALAGGRDGHRRVLPRGAALGCRRPGFFIAHGSGRRRAPAMRIVYVTQRLPFGNGETFIVPEIEALLAAGQTCSSSRAAPPIPSCTTTSMRSWPARGCMPPARAVIAGGRRALAWYTRVARRGRSGGRTNRPRRRGLSNVLATAQGMWLARLARAWGADHIHAHWAHLTATHGDGRRAPERHSLELHRSPLRRRPQQPAGREAAVGAFGRFIARVHAGHRSAAWSVRRRRPAPWSLHMGVALPPPIAPRPDSPIPWCSARAGSCP